MGEAKYTISHARDCSGMSRQLMSPLARMSMEQVTGPAVCSCDADKLRSALSGITNVEALGALMECIKVLDLMRPESTYQVKLPDGSIVDVPTPEEVLQFWAAYDALYAPQASEAKPL